MAGVAAAVAASRTGVRTLLVEKSGVIGGTAIKGPIRHICGLYAGGRRKPDDLLNKGFAQEVAERVQALSDKSRIQQMGRVFVLPFRQSVLYAALVEKCAEQNFLKIEFNAGIENVEVVRREVQKVVVRQGGGETIIEAGTVIDCTGNGDIIAQAGALFDLAPPEGRQLAGYGVRLKGIRGPTPSLPLQVQVVLGRAVDAGKLPRLFRYTVFYFDGNDEGLCKFSALSLLGQGTGKETLEYINVAIETIKAQIPALSLCEVKEISSGFFEREGRRPHGEYVLTEQDVIGAKKFQDGIVKNSWPIEFWDPESGPSYQYVPDGDYYEIPFRCMKVSGFENMLSSGRCISATSSALSSTRMIGTCLALGEKAGLAAAYRVRKGFFPAKV